MTRRSREERIQEVLACATRQVRSASVEWASSVTFLDLAVETGIDPAQIARDFGSKEELVEQLIEFMLGSSDYERYDDHIRATLDAIDELTSLKDFLTMWARLNDVVNRAEVDDLRSEMLFWATGDEGSTEWRMLGELYRTLIESHSTLADELFGAAVEAGAAPRGDLTVRDFVVVVTCVVEGLAIRSRVSPELVTPDLTARAAWALAGAVLGPDSRAPSSEMSNLKLKGQSQ